MVDWFAPVDAYCERLGPGFWAEPLNAMTNAAFVIAALWLWRRSAGVPVARVLAVILGVIGVGSCLFHTAATRWAGLADVVPIALYIVIYVTAANRYFCGWPWWVAALGAVAFVPYTAALTPLFDKLPFFTLSAVYWPVPLLIAAYALALHRRLPQVARGLAVGAAILCVSLVARSLDQPLCAALPRGTHFAWHILNALMLAHMVRVLVRHRLDQAGGAG